MGPGEERKKKKNIYIKKKWFQQLTEDVPLIQRVFFIFKFSPRRKFTTIQDFDGNLRHNSSKSEELKTPYSSSQCQIPRDVDLCSGQLYHSLGRPSFRLVIRNWRRFLPQLYVISNNHCTLEYLMRIK